MLVKKREQMFCPLHTNKRWKRSLNFDSDQMTSFFQIKRPVCSLLQTYVLDWTIGSSMHDVTFIENSCIHKYEFNETIVSLHTKSSIIKTRSAIFCIGPWTSKLFPSLEKQLTTAHQHVFYWNLSTPQLNKLSTFPVSVKIGATHLNNWYDLPSFEISGIKAAHHNLSTNNDLNDLPSLTKELLKENQKQIAKTPFSTNWRPIEMGAL